MDALQIYVHATRTHDMLAIVCLDLDAASEEAASKHVAASTPSALCHNQLIRVAVMQSVRACSKAAKVRLAPHCVATIAMVTHSHHPV